MGKLGEWGVDMAPEANTPASFSFGGEIGEFAHSPWCSASPLGQDGADGRDHRPEVCATRGPAGSGTYPAALWKES